MADEGISLGPFSKQLEALKWRGDSRKARPRDRRRAPAFVAGGERRGRLPTWLGDAWGGEKALLRGCRCTLVPVCAAEAVCPHLCEKKCQPGKVGVRALVLKPNQVL